MQNSPRYLNMKRYFFIQHRNVADYSSDNIDPALICQEENSSLIYKSKGSPKNLNYSFNTLLYNICVLQSLWLWSYDREKHIMIIGEGQ